jgi:hypothetical protein
MTSLSPSSAELLAKIKRVQRARERSHIRSQLDDAIEQARNGNVRPFVEFQWPTAVLENWQWDAIEHLFHRDIRGVWLKGNTGCGKGCIGGIICCTYFAIWPDAKIRVSRDTYENAVKIAFGEVDKWFRRMRWRPPGTLLTAGIDDGKEHWLQVSNPASDEGFHGVHSSNVLYWFDEATAGNLEARFDAALTQAHKFLATANPRTLAGTFREVFPRDNPDETQSVVNQHGKQRCITISGWDCTNVKEHCLKSQMGPIGGIEIDGRRFEHGEWIPDKFFEQRKPIIPGQTCYDEFMVWYHHPDPFKRNVFGLGKFPDEDPEFQIILPSWVRHCTERWNKWQRLWRRSELNPSSPIVPLPRDHYRGFRDEPITPEPVPANYRAEILQRLLPVECFGLDVAASQHGDSTILAAGGQYGVRALHSCQFADTTQTVEWVLDTARQTYGIELTKGDSPVAIDWGGGYGNAVGDPLRKRGVKVIEIHGNATSDVDPQRYGNKRAELYGELGRRVDPAGDFAESPFALPDDQELREELAVHQKVFAGRDGQKFYVTPKDRRGASENFKGKTIKEILGRSPDKADAVVYCYGALRYRGASLGEWLEAGFF